MSFVKIDCGILNSSIWLEKAQRDLFITALLMAEPHEIYEPTPQLSIDKMEPTGWIVPPGWYGFIRAAGVGIIHNAMVDKEDGLIALSELGEPDINSKSHAFEGRRLVRIDGGFLALNYVDYRERDYTGALRSKRWRERKKIKEADEEQRAKVRANGGTIKIEHRDDGGKVKKPKFASDYQGTATPRPPVANSSNEQPSINDPAIKEPSIEQPAIEPISDDDNW